ncbi:hypothetical protein [Ottowia sp. VDI28]
MNGIRFPSLCVQSLLFVAISVLIAVMAVCAVLQLALSR